MKIDDEDIRDRAVVIVNLRKLARDIDAPREIPGYVPTADDTRRATEIREIAQRIEDGTETKADYARLREIYDGMESAAKLVRQVFGDLFRK